MQLQRSYLWLKFFFLSFQISHLDNREACFVISFVCVTVHMSFLRHVSNATRTHAVVAREFSPTMLNAFPLRKRSMTRISFFFGFFSLVLRSSLTRFVNSCAPGDSYTALILRLAFPPDPCYPVHFNQLHAVCRSCRASAEHIPVSLHFSSLPFTPGWSCPPSAAEVYFSSWQLGLTLRRSWSKRQFFFWQDFFHLRALTWLSQICKMTATGLHPRFVLLLCFISTAACNTFAFTEEPSDRGGRADGYCSRVLRAQSNRKEGNSEFRLRVEGDPESYHPGSTYRGWC